MKVHHCAVCAALLAMSLMPAVAHAADLAVFGNSQIDHCGGSLAPLEAIARAGGAPIEATQLDGSARLTDHDARRVRGYDFVGLTNQESAWDAEGKGVVQAAALALHEAIVKAGGRTILWMTYATGLAGGTSAEELKVSAYRRYWEETKALLDARAIDGRTSEAILLPVMLLWEEGKKAFPSASRPADGVDRCAGGWMHDALHGGYKAQYATAALVYAYVTCRDPRGLPATDKVDAGFARWAQDKAWQYAQTLYRPRHCAGRPNPDPMPDAGTNGPTDAGGARRDASAPSQPRTDAGALAPPVDGSGGAIGGEGGAPRAGAGGGQPSGGSSQPPDDEDERVDDEGSGGVRSSNGCNVGGHQASGGGWALVFGAVWLARRRNGRRGAR